MQQLSSLARSINRRPKRYTLDPSHAHPLALTLDQARTQTLGTEDPATWRAEDSDVPHRFYPPVRHLTGTPHPVDAQKAKTKKEKACTSKSLCLFVAKPR
jgi:hypothetical protein